MMEREVLLQNSLRSAYKKFDNAGIDNDSNVYERIFETLAL